MNPTVAEILEYESFLRAEPRVLAGAEALDRPVRWVHISEMTDVADLLRGGELLLTQGGGIPGDENGQRQWVRELADAGIVGIAIELGEVIFEMPPYVVDQAKELGIPLIALTDQAFFMDMTEAVHSTIVNLQYRMLQRAEQASTEFSQLALEGGGPKAIIDKLAQLVGNPVVLTDHAHEVSEYAPQTDQVIHLLQSWSRHARQGHPANQTGPSQAEPSELPCVWCPIRFRKELWGSIHILAIDRPIDQADRLSLDRAAAAIGLAFAAASAEPRPSDTHSTLVHDLVDGYQTDTEHLINRARAVGVDVTGQLRLLLIRPAASEWEDTELTTSSQVRNRLLQACAKYSRRLFTDHESRPLIGYGTNELLVIATETPTQSRSRLAHRAEELSRECTNGHGATLVIGISPAATVETLSRAYEDADEAVRYALHTGRGPQVVLAEQLGLDRVLLELDASGYLVRHIEHELGAVLDHDARSTTPLLPTLAAYLDCGARKTQAAAALNIQRGTLYYRIRQLQELIGDDLDSADAQLRLLLAIRGLHLRRKSLHARRQA